MENETIHLLEKTPQCSSDCIQIAASRRPLQAQTGACSVWESITSSVSSPFLCFHVSHVAFFSLLTKLFSIKISN